MFKNLKNDRGIALIMVLVLLILVGGLVGALMQSGVFNVRFGGNDVERTQSLYAADAGVEFTKVWMNNGGLDIINEIKFDGSRDIEDLIITSEESFSDNQSFTVKVDNLNNNIITFLSTGNPGSSYERKIKFGLDIQGGEGTLPGVLLRYIEDRGYDINDYADFHGQEDDGTINSDILNLTDLYNEDDNIGFNDWNSVLDSFDLIDEEGNFKGENSPKYSYIGDDSESTDYNKETSLSNFRLYLDDNIKGNEMIGPEPENPDNKDFQDPHRYYSKSEVTLETDIGGSVKIQDSIIIVDGSLKFSGTPEVRNSVIIVRGDVDFNGANDFHNSFVFSYLDQDTGATKVNGVPSTGFTRDDDFSYPGLSDQFMEKLTKLVDSQSLIRSYSFSSDWRQVQ